MSSKKTKRLLREDIDADAVISCSIAVEFTDIKTLKLLQKNY